MKKSISCTHCFPSISYRSWVPDRAVTWQAVYGPCAGAAGSAERSPSRRRPAHCPNPIPNPASRHLDANDAGAARLDAWSFKDQNRWSEISKAHGGSIELPASSARFQMRTRAKHPERSSWEVNLENTANVPTMEYQFYNRLWRQPLKKH